MTKYSRASALHGHEDEAALRRKRDAERSRAPGFPRGPWERGLLPRQALQRLRRSAGVVTYPT